MTVGEVLDGAQVLSGLTETLREAGIGGIAYDSRKVASGALFFAFPGTKADGRQFAAEAIGKGALAVVSELPAPDTFRAAGSRWRTGGAR